MLRHNGMKRIYSNTLCTNMKEFIGSFQFFVAATLHLALVDKAICTPGFIMGAELDCFRLTSKVWTHAYLTIKPRNYNEDTY